MKTILIEVREQIQEDLLCLLDLYPYEIRNKACQIIVDNFKKLERVGYGTN